MCGKPQISCQVSAHSQIPDKVWHHVCVESCKTLPLWICDVDIPGGNRREVPASFHLGEKAGKSSTKKVINICNRRVDFPTGTITALSTISTVTTLHITCLLDITRKGVVTNPRLSIQGAEHVVGDLVRNRSFGVLISSISKGPGVMLDTGVEGGRGGW